ncbi:MAG TPA: FAD-binding oxidoreductase, partial [Atopostipes sp.]|nr:FAD-binding oxidoreductase [Atopostipes sp.]
MLTKIAVIGGGVVGSTAAFYLSKNPEFEVTLFDEDTGQATSASAGIINPWLSKRRNKEWYHMVKLGAAFYPTFLKEVFKESAIPNEVYQKVGTLLFTKKDKTLEELLEIGRKRRKAAPEIGDLHILTPEEIQEKIPIYTKEKRALFASGGARVDGKALIEEVREAAKNQGLRMVEEYATLKRGLQNKWVIETNHFKEEFEAVILANSAWLPHTLEPLGYEVDVRPQKGQ